MKVKFLIPLIIIVSLLFSFIGYKKGEIDTDRKYQNTNIEYHKRQIEKKEDDKIFDLLEINGFIKTKRQGSLFNKYNVKYIDLRIRNNAFISVAKNITIQIDFLSKTKKVINSTKFVIYEQLKPGDELSYKKDLYPPKEMENFTLKIINIE